MFDASQSDHSCSQCGPWTSPAGHLPTKPPYVKVINLCQTPESHGGPQQLRDEKAASSSDRTSRAMPSHVGGLRQKYMKPSVHEAVKAFRSAKRYVKAKSQNPSASLSLSEVTRVQSWVACRYSIYIYIYIGLVNKNTSAVFSANESNIG